MGGNIQGGNDRGEMSGGKCPGGKCPAPVRTSRVLRVETRSAHEQLNNQFHVGSNVYFLHN